MRADARLINRLSFWSRDRATLIRAAVAIAAASILLALIIDQVREKRLAFVEDFIEQQLKDSEGGVPEGFRQSPPEPVPSPDVDDWGGAGEYLAAREAGAWALVRYFYRDVGRAALGGFAAIALFAGVIWYAIVKQLTAIPLRRWAVGVAAVALGMLSTPPVLVVASLLNLHENGEPLNDLIFFVAGVGLREETCKIAFFLPLLPLALRERSPALAAGLGGLVGLGFAIAENIYSYSLEVGLWGRFLTANFFHISLTSLLALACYDFCRWPKHRWEKLVATFLGVVAVHGVYDFFAMHDILEANILPIIVFGFFTFFYLRQITEVRPREHQKVSPLGVFCVGSALLLGLALNFHLWDTPFFSAMGFGAFGNSFAGTATLAFLFINEFRDA
ncbi:MAG: PrsW family glutamic-type intramembrane protease [Verrucomicrobiales bacterium]